MFIFLKQLLTDTLSKKEILRSTYFLLALAVLSLNLSFFDESDSFSLERAEEGDSGESRRSRSSLRAWIL